MDVCIGCVDIGRTVVDSVFRPALPVFFSKKTSPEYSVAEAVRRSMSLPYLFYPRRMTDGRGSRVPDYTDGDVSVTYSQHWNRFLLDGGFKINLPVSVFLDRQSTFMSNQFVNDEPAKHVAIFLLDETEDAPPRPDDVRFARLPSPLRQIIQQAGDEARRTQDTPLVPDSEGIGDSSVYASDIRKRNYLLAVGLQVLDFAFGTRQALELKPIYAALPKTLFVDIGVRDPNWETGDSRINAGHFGMSKQTKRWIVRSAWEAGRRALQEVASDGIDIGISDEVTAYPLSVGITLISPAVYQVVARAKDGDTLYIDAPTLRANSRTGAVATQNTFRLGSQFGDVYDGLGATWIKTANADRDATEADLLIYRRHTLPRAVADASDWESRFSRRWLDEGEGSCGPPRERPSGHARLWRVVQGFSGWGSGHRRNAIGRRAGDAAKLLSARAGTLTRLLPASRSDGERRRTDRNSTGRSRPCFHRLPPPTDADIAWVRTRLHRCVRRLLARRGRGPDDDPGCGSKEKVSGGRRRRIPCCRRRTAHAQNPVQRLELVAEGLVVGQRPLLVGRQPVGAEAVSGLTSPHPPVKPGTRLERSLPYVVVHLGELEPSWNQGTPRAAGRVSGSARAVQGSGCAHGLIDRGSRDASQLLVDVRSL